MLKHKTIPGRYRFNADAHDMYRLLGVTKSRLPVEGMPERVIHGVRVYVKPLPPNTSVRRNFQGLRVMAICECGQHLAVGRLHQHRCKTGERYIVTLDDGTRFLIPNETWTTIRSIAKEFTSIEDADAVIARLRPLVGNSIKRERVR